MLNKQKTKWIWCNFEGKLPNQTGNKPSNKRFRCPECGKRFLIFEKSCECCWPSSITYWISKHKKKVMDISYD